MTLTDKQWLAFQEDLKVTKIKRKKDESTSAYARRLALKANDVDDDTWSKLDEATQKWVNESLEAIEGDQPISLPEGEMEEVSASVDKKDKEAKPTKSKAKTSSGADSRGRPARYSLSAKVKILTKPNPHRQGTKSHGYYESYKDGMTLEKILAKGIPRAEVNWHVDRGIIEFSS